MMRNFPLHTWAALCAATLLTHAVVAQPAPDGGGGDRPPRGGRPGGGEGRGGSMVDRMMTFDANKDGKLTREEVTDERLQRLFDRADADKDGLATRDELNTLAASVQAGDGGGRRGGPDGRGGTGGPGGAGEGRSGPEGRGPGGPPQGGRPQPGQVIPAGLRDNLNLTAEQRTQLDELQKDVDAKLAKILTDDQKKQLEEIRQRGGPRPGFGGGRGPGGPGAPGGGRGPDRAGAQAGPPGGL